MLITDERFPDASEDCKEFDCRYLTAEDRVVLRKRWCTNLGKGKAIPKHHAPESEIPVFSVNNDTVKIVIHITQAYSGETWEQALNNPGAAVRGWLKEVNIEKNLVHSYRPVLKGEGNTKYLDQICLLNGDGGSIALKAGGQGGFFAKPFVGGQHLLDEFRIVWIGLGEDLKSTLAKSYLLGVKNRGLAFSRYGLGIRVLKVHYEECGKKLLGDLFKPASTGNLIYEVSKIPVWVSPDCAQVLMETICGWKTEIIRTIKSFGEYKSFIVRATEAPLKVCFYVGSDMAIIQKARHETRPKGPVSYFTGNQKSEEAFAKKVVSKSGVGEFPLHPIVAIQTKDDKNFTVGPDGKRRRKSAGDAMDL